MMHRIDLYWDDREVLPERIRPDVEFLLNRMNEATLEIVAAAPGEIILDVGCGRAIDAVNISKSGAKVVGLDPSQVMLKYANEWINQDGHNTTLLRGIGEFIPICRGSIDKVVCKGALDHFADPLKAIQQMAAVVKPGGYVIIAVANFESLGFKFGKFIYGVRKFLHIRNPHRRLPWQLPPDHTVKFDYKLILETAAKNLEIEKVIGVSIFGCMPGWGDILASLPARMTKSILARLDRIAYMKPVISDVVILRGIAR